MPTPSASSSTPFFRPPLFAFLRDLADHNEREWFRANKQRYEDEMVEPALAFVTAFGLQLEEISPHFRAIPQRSGGSLYRIYRDTRFAKDKTPYKTHLGIHFRHERHKDAHAPGFYLHIEPARCFMGAGIWRPDSPTLRKIREHLVSDPAAWKRATSGEAFEGELEVAGDRLQRPPRGFDPEHPQVEDLKLKDFLCVASLTQKEVCSGGFLDRYGDLCRGAAPFVRWLCDAIDVRY